MMFVECQGMTETHWGIDARFDEKAVFLDGGAATIQHR